MLAHVGLEVTVEDLLARWERDVGAVSDREAALVWLREFVAGLDRLKIGNLVEIQYVTGRGPELHKVHDAPPTEGIVPLPQ